MFAWIVCSYEIINLIYGAPAHRGWVGVIALIVCSYEVINLLYGASGVGGCVCMDCMFV